MDRLILKPKKPQIIQDGLQGKGPKKELKDKFPWIVSLKMSRKRGWRVYHSIFL